MPAYDCEAFVGEAVASVLGQTMADLELVVVDDGSRDRTADVVAAIADPRLRLVRRRHAGIAATLNAGLAATRAPLLTRLDADDVWLPPFLAVTCAALDARPDADVAYARARAVDVAGRPLGRSRGMSPCVPGDALASMLVRDFTVNIALVSRRECVEGAGGYDESLAASEDWDIWLRVSRAHRFVFVDEVLACFRERPGSVTRTAGTGPAIASDRLRILDRAFAEPGLTEQALAVRPLAYRNALFDLGLAWWSAGDLARAARAFADGIVESDAYSRATARLAYNLFLHHFGRHSTVERLRAAASRLRRRLGARA